MTKYTRMLSLLFAPFLAPFFLSLQAYGLPSHPSDSLQPTAISAGTWSGADPVTMQSIWAKRFQLESLWETATGKGVTMAVCDSGFLLGDPDLDGNIYVNRALDILNLDPIVDDSKFSDQGTASLSIIASVRDGLGLTGIAFNSKVLPLQHFHYDPQLDGKFSLAYAGAQCIYEAIKNMDVSMVLLQSSTYRGSAESDDLVRSAIRDATKSGLIVVIPAGNSSKELVTEKIYETQAILVGATLTNGKQALFSNYGARVNVGAYGENVQANFGQGKIASLVGTTAAAAQITGLVALFKEANPCLRPEDVGAIFKKTNTIDDSNRRIGGLVNPAAALALAKSLPCQNLKMESDLAYRKQLLKKMNP